VKYNTCRGYWRRLCADRNKDCYRSR